MFNLCLIRAIITLLILAPCAAHAANVEQGAEQTIHQRVDQNYASALKSLIEEIFTEETAAFAPGNNPELQYEGSFSVEPLNGYYAITFPFLRLIYPREAMLEIGIISLNVTPRQDSETLWNIAAAIPSPITLYDVNGTAALSLDITEQTIRGLWDNQNKTFAAIDASIGVKDLDTVIAGLHTMITALSEDQAYKEQTDKIQTVKNWLENFAAIGTRSTDENGADITRFQFKTGQ